MKIFLLLSSAVIVTVVILLSSCVTHLGRVGGSAPTAPSRDIEVWYDRVYTPSGWPESLAGDVYLPKGAGPYPGVMVVHGGGWERRDRSDMTFVAERLARRGFVAFNISYRFAPDYEFPAQLHDLQAAVRWMRSNAGELRLDRARIGGFGYSSGGHLVALLGMLGHEESLDSPNGGQAARLQAVVAGGMPSDLRAFPDGRLVRQFLGGPMSEIPDTYAKASPITHVDAGDPPTFVYHAGWDRLVPPDQARAMRRALNDAGVPNELYLVHGHGHMSLFLLNRSAVDKGIDFLSRVLVPAT